MQLIIIRHGESEADILDVHEGRADFSLTDKGFSQARQMARYVKKSFKPIKIYSSTLKRAYQTASELSAECGIDIIQMPELMEFNNGLLAGLSRKEAARKYPEIKNLPLHSSVYSQESQLEFRHRAEYVLSEIISKTADSETVAVVTHGGMINQLYRAFLRLPVDCDLFFPTYDTGIHIWRIKEEKRIVLQANSKQHLSHELQ